MPEALLAAEYAKPGVVPAVRPSRPCLRGRARARGTGQNWSAARTQAPPEARLGAATHETRTRRAGGARERRKTHRFGPCLWPSAGSTVWHCAHLVLKILAPCARADASGARGRMATRGAALTHRQLTAGRETGARHAQTAAPGRRRASTHTFAASAIFSVAKVGVVAHTPQEREERGCSMRGAQRRRRRWLQRRRHGTRGALRESAQICARSPSGASN